jgi:hypothetical protein
MEGYEDLVPEKSSAGDDYADLIPKGKPRTYTMFGVPPDPKAEAKGYGEALKGFASGALQNIYGMGELLPGELGKSSAEATRYFQQVGPKEAQIAGQLVTPLPAAKLLKGASATKQALGLGGLVAATTGTGEEDYATRLKEKAKSGGVATALGLGAGVVAPYIAKTTKDLISSFKKPAAIADAEALDVVGEKGFDLIKKKAEKLYGARSAEADQKYNEAFDAARKAQALGEPFAVSNQGRALIQSLEAEKSVLAGGERFARGEEKIAGINRLIDAIKGKTTGGIERVSKETPAGKKIFRMEGEPKKTTEKDIEAIVEELRFLRDVDAKGKPYEAYAALDANYKRDLIKKLESALYTWNPKYKAADEAYKAASAQLAPFRTQLMSDALKGEKFDPKNLVASPEEFGPKFFSDVDGVRQLKDVTQDTAAVSQLGKEYVASLMSNKTPQQIQAFAKDPKNIGWMREAGVLDDVTKYANAAEKAESRQEILKKLGYAAGAGTLGAAIGLPMYYGVRRTFGL